MPINQFKYMFQYVSTLNMIAWVLLHLMILVAIFWFVFQAS